MIVCIFPIIDKSWVNQHDIVTYWVSWSFFCCGWQTGGRAYCWTGGSPWWSRVRVHSGGGLRSWPPMSGCWGMGLRSCTLSPWLYELQRKRDGSIFYFGRYRHVKSRKLQSICLNLNIEERYKIIDFIKSTMDHQFVYQNLLTIVRIL